MQATLPTTCSRPPQAAMWRSAPSCWEPTRRCTFSLQAPLCVGSSTWRHSPSSMQTPPSTNKPQCLSTRPVGLILTGGGARAAYQAGVLSGVIELLNPGRSPDFCNPFSILCGTSAGAINAAAYACHAHDPRAAVDGLVRMWSGLHTGMVYHADAWRLLRTGL